MGSQWTCVVCDEAVEETDSSVCNGCGERFHLNPRSDKSGKDCGDVWINDHYLALQFACRRCLGASPPPPPKPRILRPRLGQRRYRKRA